MSHIAFKFHLILLLFIFSQLVKSSPIMGKPSYKSTSQVDSPPLSNVVITGTWLVQAAAKRQVEMAMMQRKTQESDQID